MLNDETKQIQIFQTGKSKTKYLDNNLNLYCALLNLNIYGAQLNKINPGAWYTII